MRIGLVEFILILFIASITIGPNVALWVDRWSRRARKTSAAAARRRAQMQAQAIAEREYVLHRFQVASRIFSVMAPFSNSPAFMRANRSRLSSMGRSR